jgi:hypothetical protein
MFSLTVVIELKGGVKEWLYTQLIITSKYNSLTGLHTLKITVTAAQI